MVRRASKREHKIDMTTRADENSNSTSTHEYKDSPNPAKKTLKGSKIRGRTPPGERRDIHVMPPMIHRSSRNGNGNGDGNGNGNGQGSSTGQPWSTTPTTTPLTATSTVDPETPGGSRSREDHHPITAIRSRNMVPSTWTTASGNFDPKESLLGFDARSNIGINGALVFGSSNSVVTGADLSECSPSSFSYIPEGSGHSPQRSVVSHRSAGEGEIEDLVQRNRFYKNLKKKGIKKQYAFDENWETCSTVSEISISAASYILDLAQQKESRTKDREQEALEEALDLYGTWLTEGKTDDKNIFMMILHEVKKEFKLKYTASDRRQDALLDAALEEEIQRREQIKSQQEEEEARKLTKSRSGRKTARYSHDSTIAVEGDQVHSNRTITVHNASISRINEIIEKNASQKFIDRTWDCDDDSINTGDERTHKYRFTDEWKEPNDSNERLDMEEESKPKRKNKIRSILSWGKKSNKGTGQASTGPKKGSDGDDGVRANETGHEQENENHDEDVDPILSPADKEDSNRMFSRLRIKLSEKNAQQRKEEEKWWKKINHVETKEEKWWKKINEAQKEATLFDHGINLDRSRREQLDATNRTDSTADPKEPAPPITSSQSIASAAPSAKEGKKAKHDRKKSLSLTDDADANFMRPALKKEKSEKRRSESSKKKKSSKAPKDFDSSLPGEGTEKGRDEKTKDTEAKRDKKKKKKSSEGPAEDNENKHETHNGDTSPLDSYMNAYMDDLKSPKSKDSKDKKKKKKSKSDNEVLQSPKSSKKREKLSREVGASLRALTIPDESEESIKAPKTKTSRRVSQDGSKTAATDELELKSTKSTSKKKKSKDKGDGDSPFEDNGKKKKKKSDGTLLTDDAVQGSDESREGTDKCIFDGNDSEDITEDSALNVLSDIPGAEVAQPVQSLP
eukprot:jgi/Psemu1/70140/estExt_Genemark1.C_14590002